MQWEFQSAELEDYEFECDDASKRLKGHHVSTMNVVEVMRSTSSNATIFKRMNKTLYDIAQASLDILRDIVEGFPKLRMEFKVFERRLSDKVSIFPKQIYPLLSEIYRGSVSQVQNTPPALFAQFGDLLADINQANNMISLEFYLTQLKPEKEVSDSIYRNQILVSQGLYDSHSSPASIFKFEVVNSDELFLHHVTAIHVLSECCKSNGEIVSTGGSAVLPWKNARVRLTGLLQAFVAIGTMDTPDDRTPLYMDRDGDTELPVGMGMGLTGVVGTADQYVCFLQTYIDYVNWTYLSSTAIEVGLLFDDAMINIIALLCEVIRLYYSVDMDTVEGTAAVSDERPVIALNTVVEEEGRVEEEVDKVDEHGEGERGENATVSNAKDKEEDISGIVFVEEEGNPAGQRVKGAVDLVSMAAEARRRDIYTSIVNFFISYVTVVNMTKRQIPSVVVEGVYFSCCEMKSRFGPEALRICTDMGLV